MDGLFLLGYHIVQNSGREKLWQIANFKNLVGKTLEANFNKLSLSSSIKTCHSHTMLNLKPQSYILSSHATLKWAHICSVKCGEA